MAVERRRILGRGDDLVAGQTVLVDGDTDDAQYASVRRAGQLRSLEHDGLGGRVALAGDDVDPVELHVHRDHSEPHVEVVLGDPVGVRKIGLASSCASVSPGRGCRRSRVHSFRRQWV